MTGHPLPAFAGKNPDDRTLIDVVSGLVEIHLLELRDPVRLAEAIARREELADLLGCQGDRILNRSAFRDKESRQARRKVLNAIALTIALGVRVGGAVDWAGVHFCRVEHPNCPHKETHA